MNETRNKGGRPLKYPGERRRPPVAFRCRHRTRERLDDLAARNGWSLSEAIDRVIEGYFEREDMADVVRSAVNEALDRREPADGAPLGSPAPAYAQ